MKREGDNLTELLVPPDRNDDAQSQDQTIDTHGDQ